MLTKHCTRCAETKPVTEFYKDKSVADGTSHYCKKCKKSMVLEKYHSRDNIPPLTEGAKRCGRCKTMRPVGEFSLCRRHPDGLNRTCKSCVKEINRANHLKDPTRGSRHAAAYRKLHPDRVADYEVKKRYKLPAGSYAEMLASQNGKCAICASETPGRKGVQRFAIDHCHDSGKIRGLLCSRCNIGIGHFLHDEKLLKSAILYLRFTP